MKNKYILEVGEQGKSRLELMSSFLNPLSQRFLTDVGIKQGMKVLEIGCGTGSMTIWLAQKVGPQGKVTVIDNSEEQLKIARERLKHIGVENVDFICTDIEEYKQATNAFELIYSRFLLLHLQQPAMILNLCRDLLQKNGVLVCEEPIVSEVETFPKTEIWSRAQALYIALSEKNGVDADFGLRLYHEINKASFSITQASFAQAIITKQETIDYLEKAYNELKDILITEKLMTLSEYEANINDLFSDKYNHIIYGTFHRVAQIAARKL